MYVRCSLCVFKRPLTGSRPEPLTRKGEFIYSTLLWPTPQPIQMTTAGRAGRRSKQRCPFSGLWLPAPRRSSNLTTHTRPASYMGCQLPTCKYPPAEVPSSTSTCSSDGSRLPGVDGGGASSLQPWAWRALTVTKRDPTASPMAVAAGRHLRRPRPAAASTSPTSSTGHLLHHHQYLCGFGRAAARPGPPR